MGPRRPGCDPRCMTSLRRAETPLFRAAAGLAVVHLAHLHHWMPMLLVGGLAVAYPRLAPAWRAALAFVMAPAFIVTGAMHVLHVRWDGLNAGDATGIPLLAAGGAMLLAAALALLSRPPAPVAWRLGRGALTVAAVPILALFLIVPLATGLWLAGKPRQPISSEPLGVPHVDASFPTTGGAQLRGWYVPSRNGAAVVLVHGGGGSRDGVRTQALLLARHGYGVLLYDERGRGESTGHTNGMGWDWPDDVCAAVDWLRTRPDVTRGVGALGESTGAEAVIGAAAEDRRIRAVVAEGVINHTLADNRNLKGADKWMGYPYWGVAYAVIRAETHTPAPKPIDELVRKVAPRPLLLIAAKQNAPERKVAPAYAQAGGATTTLWLADTGHTHALRDFPQQFERRVVGLFDRALLG